MNRLQALLFAFILFYMPAALFGQDTDTLGFVGFNTPAKGPYKANVIKTSPIPMLIMGQIPWCDELRFTYERVLTNHHSIEVGASYNYPNLILMAVSSMDTGSTKLSDFSFRGARVILGYRYYPLKRPKKKEAPAGLFVGPYLSYNFVKIKEKGGNGSSESLHYFNASIIAGYQIVSKKGFAIEFFTGLGYRDNFITNYDARTNRTTNSALPSFISPRTPSGDRFIFIDHIKFILQFNLGYAF
jgi:hypothetical protein